MCRNALHRFIYSKDSAGQPLCDWRYRATFVMLVCVLWLFSSACSLLLKPTETVKFTVQGWYGPMTDVDWIFTGTRLKMVDDLLGTYDFHGWTYRDITELLGEPDQQKRDGPSHQIFYDLRDGLNFLIFKLDQDGRVIVYYTVIGD